MYANLSVKQAYGAIWFNNAKAYANISAFTLSSLIWASTHNDDVILHSGRYLS